VCETSAGAALTAGLRARCCASIPKVERRDPLCFSIRAANKIGLMSQAA